MRTTYLKLTNGGFSSLLNRKFIGNNEKDTTGRNTDDTDWTDFHGSVCIRVIRVIRAIRTIRVLRRIAVFFLYQGAKVLLLRFAFFARAVAMFILFP
ncbi:MAG: hypothetical protein FIB08_07030 [Candidatus Methanoperedens sp.]|nr:hypothetical protein [Candidatus Methanoperedens sp.]